MAWLTALPAWADPFLRQVERATPARRVLMVLNYFDTSRVVTQNQVTAFRVLNELDTISKRQQDDQLRRYSQFLRDTYAKNSNGTNPQKAELFLAVAQKAKADNDPQIAGVCEHFAGLYFFLAEDDGKAFQYSLAANNRFQQIGYEQIPEIQRYLYELAFNYYYLHEDRRAGTGQRRFDAVYGQFAPEREPDRTHHYRRHVPGAGRDIVSTVTDSGSHQWLRDSPNRHQHNGRVYCQQAGAIQPHRDGCQRL